MKHIVFFIISLILFSSCYNHKYPNGDGTMTVVEYNIFKKDSVVLYNVKCPVEHKGNIISTKKGHHYVGVAGKNRHSVTHYDIEVTYTADNKSINTFKDRISTSTYHRMMKKGYVIMREEFYPRHNVHPVY